MSRETPLTAEMLHRALCGSMLTLELPGGGPGGQDDVARVVDVDALLRALEAEIEISAASSFDRGL